MRIDAGESTMRRTAARLRTIQVFPSSAPPALVLDGVRDDLAHQAAERAASVKTYTVRVGLDPRTAGERHDELALHLADNEPILNLDASGPASVEFTLTGHDVWEVVLSAMVSLTNAGCMPVNMHIEQTGTQ
jgi:hypothetical protein